ncbi:Aluminum-activated malate transporter [Thalictrum thalictroides]|uniref:Aluminum-activated malate transporter n=1 Tax=Thalictrum thalictroides TaxID=46969 RepID=A0A7J6VIS7_THATH|nr:Aluminum-activated malate transporter [Thalictrum thalictroides]
MEAKACSFRHSFVEKRQRLLSQGYSNGCMESINGGTKHHYCPSLGDMIIKPWKALQETITIAWQYACSEPRNVVFSAKVGLALVIISVLMFMNIPNKAIDKYAIWGIMTVILVFEFSIGATLNKGFNRGLGTLFAGGLAMGVAELSLMTEKLEVAFIISSIFIAGFCSTVMKLYPKMKHYEYGFRVFLLTYCFILVSGYKKREFLKTAVNRFLLILIGAAVSLLVNICIYPIWAGEDLHNLVVKNFSAVANALEGCIDEYLQYCEYDRITSKYPGNQGLLYEGCMSAVRSTSREETLEGFALWEPPHGRYKKFNYPWRNYVKLSGALRHCAFVVLALGGCIDSEIQAPPECRQVFSSELKRVSSEGAKVLRELAEKIDKMEKLKAGDGILLEVCKAAEELQNKIDRKSYLLINSDSCLIKKPEDLDNSENLFDIQQNDNKILRIKSFSETCLDLRSVLLSKSSNEISTTKIVESLPTEGVLSKSTSNEQILWSSYSLTFEDVHNDKESKTYGSASALSLATFTSLLIEFVFRLQYLVEVFQELSEAACFKESIVDLKAETKSMLSGQD